MQLTTAEIDRYGPLFDCRPPCQDGLTVLSGPNEAGKTLYLEGLLQLLSPEVGDHLDPRVDGEPTGRVVVEHGGDRHEFGNGDSVCEVTPIDPPHLQSIFVVRDDDLHLPGGKDYYTSLIEKLGDIHTSEIAAITSGLKDAGRLTDARLDVSSDREYHDAGDVRDEASALAEEIREYTDRIQADGLDELETERLRCERELRAIHEQVQAQRDAELASEYARLSDQLETYRTTSRELADLAAFDRETLEDLRELQRQLEAERDELEGVAAEIDETDAAIDEAEAELERRTEAKAALERRADSVSSARNALQRYRDRHGGTETAKDRLGLTRTATVAGLLGAGGAGAAGAVFGSSAAIGLGVVLLVVAIVSGLGYYRSSQRLASLRAARQDVLQAARDAGLDVESVEDVAPAIEAFESDLETARERVTRKQERLDGLEEDLRERKRERSSLRDSIEDAEDRLATELETLEVEAVDDVEERVERREDVEGKRKLARQSLVDEFGTPDVDGHEARADAWERQLESMVEAIDLDDVDPDDYDETELDRLESEVGSLEHRRDELETALEEYDDRLDAFDRRARQLDTTPFVGDAVGLDARTKAGLEALADDLEAVVDAIERDAEYSRKAIRLFEEIEDQEEQKLTELFDPDGPASRTFERLTGGRYTEVAYDADGHELAVETRDGRRMAPDLLSQATTDQLYFATRVSLAQQLLGNEPGFLLLDDPFLAADSARLAQGFESLLELADDGWQILYLTAKEEVSEGMVSEYGLDHVEMEALPV